MQNTMMKFFNQELKTIEQGEEDDTPKNPEESQSPIVKMKGSKNFKTDNINKLLKRYTIIKNSTRANSMINYKSPYA